MGGICGDNRFEVIAKAKKELLFSTNIDTAKDEMKVIDSFLFRCWQMGWLDRYDKPREPLDIPTMTTEFIKEHGLPCPNNYIFKDENGNVINATKIVLEKKKKEYPKTYEECCKVIEVPYIKNYVAGYKNGLLDNFQRLLICRDAYWKIAGEEMGLGKPWEPDWKDGDTHKFIIHVIKDEIRCGVGLVRSDLLSFPTEEMRDAFYENFKSEIEICKELL